MTGIRILITTLLFAFGMRAYAQNSANWTTPFEISGGKRSATFAETMEYFLRMAKETPYVKVRSFGTSPQGRQLPLIIFSKSMKFEPRENEGQTDPVIMIIAGIHSGEIDGKDAGMMLFRDIAITDKLRGVANHCTILFIPIFNLDGHERQSKYNRINQDGPEEQGWRVTAQNKNLNRDFLKADTPEMRYWLRLFNEWQPDMVIDCHVTDGIDFQYNITYAMEMFENAPPSVVRWHKGLERYMISSLEKQGEPIIPYVFPREDTDLSKGLVQYAGPPRFSTGYAAIRNRAALLIETHMLKPFAMRVQATYRMIQSVLEYVNAHPDSLRTAVAVADNETQKDFLALRDSAWFPLLFDATNDSTMIPFLGYEMELRQSALSGGTYPVWHHNKPKTVTIPVFNDVRATRRVKTPFAYIIPAEWESLVHVLGLHGVRTERLTQSVRLPVVRTVFANPKWETRPYEGRHTLKADETERLDTVDYPKGTYVIPLTDGSPKAAVHLLEPDAPDSFIAWGFLDAIFEQKEYFESYVMEELAETMRRNDPALNTAFEKRVRSDSAFAKSPRARLQFFYERSPYFDQTKNLYPVGRLMQPRKLPTEVETPSPVRPAIRRNKP